MNTWDSKVYPQSSKLEEFALGVEFKTLEQQTSVKKLVDAFGEYEHGTADIEDVFTDVDNFDLSFMDDEVERRRLCLTLYRRVLEDAIQVIANG